MQSNQTTKTDDNANTKVIDSTPKAMMKTDDLLEDVLITEGKAEEVDSVVKVIMQNRHQY